MKYVLDTGIILIYLKDFRTRDFVQRKFRPFGGGNIGYLSAVSVGELRSLSVKQSWGSKRISILENLLKEIFIVDIAFEEMYDAYADIDAFCEGKHPDKKVSRSSRTLGKNDLWIAATTVIAEAELLTTDKDFLPLDGEYFRVNYIDRAKN